MRMRNKTSVKTRQPASRPANYQVVYPSVRLLLIHHLFFFFLLFFSSIHLFIHFRHYFPHPPSNLSLAYLAYQKFLLCQSFAEKTKTKETDIAFVISAAGTNSIATFMKLKDVIKNVIDKYSIGSTRYAVVSFGDAPVINTMFKDPYSR